MTLISNPRELRLPQNSVENRQCDNQRSYESQTRGSQLHPSGSQPFSFCLPLCPWQEDTLCLSAAANAPENAGECWDPLGSGGLCQVKRGQSNLQRLQPSQRALDFDLILNGLCANCAHLGCLNVACFGQIWPKVGKSGKMSPNLAKFTTEMSGFFKGLLEIKVKIQLQEQQESLSGDFLKTESKIGKRDNQTSLESRTHGSRFHPSGSQPYSF